MSNVTLELLNIEDFDSRRSLSVDASAGAGETEVKAILPGMALGLDAASNKYKRTTVNDQPFFLAYIAGDRLDVLSAGSITGVKPNDLVWLDQASVIVGTPAVNDRLKLALAATNEGKFEVGAATTPAELLLIKARVVKAAGVDGRLLVQFEKFV